MKTLFDWHRNPYRTFCRSWWRHWFDLRSLWHELKDMWHRANYGYGKRDLWALDYYLASWLPSALRDFRTRKAGRPGNVGQKQWEKELRLMEYGWIAAQHIQWECECYAEPGHDAYWERRWDYCSKIFMRRLFSLWY